MLTAVTAPGDCNPDTKHRLRLGSTGYLILFAPLAAAPQRRVSPATRLCPLVFLLISTHFVATPRIPVAPSLHSGSAI